MKDFCTCLLAIDLQNGFLSNNTRHVTDRIELLLSQVSFDLVIFTQFINVLESPHRRYLGWDRLSTPEEQDIIPQLSHFASISIRKPQYSALTQDVKEILISHQVTQVFLIGLDTDCCVLKSAADLFEMGIRPLVLEYYCASNGGAQSHEAALLVLKRVIGKEQIIYGPLDRKAVLQITRATE